MSGLDLDNRRYPSVSHVKWLELFLKVQRAFKMCIICVLLLLFLLIRWKDILALWSSFFSRKVSQIKDVPLNTEYGFKKKMKWRIKLRFQCWGKNTASGWLDCITLPWPHIVLGCSLNEVISKSTNLSPSYQNFLNRHTLYSSIVREPNYCRDCYNFFFFFAKIQAVKTFQLSQYLIKVTSCLWWQLLVVYSFLYFRWAKVQHNIKGLCL